MAREKRRKEKKAGEVGVSIYAGGGWKRAEKEREGGQAFGEQERRSKRIDSPQI